MLRRNTVRLHRARGKLTTATLSERLLSQRQRSMADLP
jgi:hypothetical protein